MTKYKLETGVGIFVLVGLVCIGYLTIKLGKMELLGENFYLLKAKFFSVSGLKPGAAVEMAGVRIGQVDSISLDTDRYVADVGLKVQKGVKVSDDTIASIKTAGLIGDKFVKLSPGNSDIYLSPGEAIVDTESALDIEELISKYVFGGVEKQ
jgi:phospholipid/cholesterol/gamma-HCH transport system substrate-binding protein